VNLVGKSKLLGAAGIAGLATALANRNVDNKPAIEDLLKTASVSYTAMVKDASIYDALMKLGLKYQKPLEQWLPRPGFKALRAARQDFNLKRVHPDISQVIGTRPRPGAPVNWGSYNPATKTAEVPYHFDYAIRQHTPQVDRRHELLHGYQHNLPASVVPDAPVSRLGIGGATMDNLGKNKGSLCDSLKELMLETDARIGANRNPVTGALQMLDDAGEYTGKFQGLAKLPWMAADGIGQLLRL
jgi:hypothetical protein